MTGKQKGYIADFTLLVVAAVWGGGFVVAKMGLDYFPPVTLMANRFILASALMGIFLFKWIGQITKEDIKAGLILGTLNFVAFTAQTLGLLYTTAGKQGVFTTAYVLFVPFLVWAIYKKSPGIRIFISVFLALIGIVVMSYQDLMNLTLNLGDMLTIFSAVIYALIIIFVDRVAKNIGAIKLNFLQCLFTAIPLLLVALIFEERPSELSLKGWSVVIYLAVFSTFICYICQFTAQKYTAPSRASLIMSAESVFAVLFGVILLGETMTMMQYVGMFILLASIVMVEISPRRKAGLDKNVNNNENGDLNE